MRLRGAGAARRAGLAGLAGLLLLSSLVACSSSGGSGDDEPDSPDTLRVLAGSEVKDLVPLLEESGVKVKLSYTGTLDGAEQVAGGAVKGKYDAIWFSSNRYLSLIDGASAQLSTQTKIMASPVVLGLRASKASELGWNTKQVTWADITAAAAAKKFTFGMTNPASSNSGFSALVGVAAALSNTGDALDRQQIAAVEPKLKEFFSAQTLTAGSSGWLADAYPTANGVDGLINYESVLLAMNASGKLKEPLTIIYPSDGVVTADYPLTLLSSAATPKRALYAKLAAWLRTPATQQKIMTTTNRRPIIPDVRPDQRFGTRTLLELPFPNRRSAADELISAYLNEVRRPSRTVFVLDTSGSMEGERLDGLKRALTALTGGDTSASGTFARFRNRETVTLLPFNNAPQQSQTFTLPEGDSSPVLTQIRQYSDRLFASGGTAIFDSLRAAYEQTERTLKPDEFTSIVLMSDGENTDGSSYDDFASYYQTTPRNIRTFVVLFGDSNSEEMSKVATLTGGAAFDARSGSLASAFKEIRGYQ
ncbi:VWA domain-containing protein [Streptosporangiaceae bacterium NEAU-GS5]|nr:VWA domain-containing protein [Streptosporangiaceae bacterium NEAU-GS5]